MSVENRFVYLLLIFLTMHIVSSVKDIFFQMNRTFRERYIYEKDFREPNFFSYRFRMFKLLILVYEIMFIIMFLVINWIPTKEIDDSDISIQIENISNNLDEASSELSSIQQELENRIKFVENLKKEAEVAENVISLSDEQVKAVQAKLNQELKTSSNENLIQTILISSVFFVLGIVAPTIIKFVKSKIRKNSKDDTTNTEIVSSNTYSDEEIEQALKLLATMEKHKNS